MASSEPELKIWERRPWPTQGDDDIDKLFSGVGKALSQWEKVEGHLAILFSSFISNSSSLGARRSYVAVRTFEGRAEMLRAASAAYFSEKPSIESLKLFKEVLSKSVEFSKRRNDIAHGTADYFLLEKWKEIGDDDDMKELFSDNTYAYYPSWASFKERDLKNWPTYCLTSKELCYFENQFKSLIAPISSLIGQILLSYKKRP